MSFQEDLKKLAEKVKQYRDEARVQMHLAHEDIRDEWDDLEEDWKRFKSRLDALLHDSNKTTQETKDSIHSAGERLREAYKHLRERRH